MNVLEKILEEIEEIVNFRERLVKYEKRRGTVTDVCRNKGALEELDIVAEIIRSHMSEKEKVSSAEIISRDIGGKPYYEIKYKKVGEDHYTVGYSSYFLDYVIDWLNNYFEFCGEPKIVADVGKDTNVPSNDGWISVEERLPEGTGYYLAQLSRKLPNEDYSDRVVVLFNGEEKEFMCYANLIIAWHTLPEWYKPDEKSKETN